MFEGGSQPKTTVVVAGESYLLKLPTSDAPLVTFDELFGVIVADLAGIPTAPVALVEASAGLPMVEGGWYFGCRILDDHAPLDPLYISSDLSDEARDELYYLMALDLLIENNDRKFPDLLRRGSGPLIPVDHGNALTGADWTAEHLGKCLDAGIDVNDRRIVYCTLTDAEYARRLARRLVATVKDRLLSALDECCAHVPLAEAERNAVAALVIHRVLNLEQLAVRQVQEYAAFFDQTSSNASSE